MATPHASGISIYCANVPQPTWDTPFRMLYSILADSFSHEFRLYTDGLLTGTNLLATWSTT